MDIHGNARTLPHSRMLIVRRLAAGWSVSAVATATGVTAKTVRKWRDRYATEGARGLVDRSSRPHRSPARLDPAGEDAIEALRRQRLSSPAIARRLGRPVSTVGQVLRRRSLGRLSALDPRPPVIRYERQQPGELVHIDIKKLGRIDGIGHRITGDRTGQSNRPKQPARRRPRPRLGVPARRHRRPLAPGLHTIAAQRTQRGRHRLPGKQLCLLQAARHHRPARHD